ncbi:hypothetical protein BDV39DRAFT_183333 [Aspergillus sergii]|uniref:Uncharacterized protein n=1 Tax=Aspergillus sergii TaxID=1034303 RepID=A0A5N6WQ16_9EURO|nr:hypothetical protein BDV39DRAFT_183333 [Aspergillus sergii]
MMKLAIMLPIPELNVLGGDALVQDYKGLSEIKDCLRMSYCVMVLRGGKMGRGQFLCLYVSTCLYGGGACLLAFVKEGARLLRLSKASGHENRREDSCWRREYTAGRAWCIPWKGS